MIATCTINESGQIELPESLRRIFQAAPGVRLRAEVTATAISPDAPHFTGHELTQCSVT